ncbi:hypothetical protein LCGC14_0463800 [marine sediment metagenome]|uniref:Methyltransferase type 11 domain-containing protein n=1 Tax=marine sediment metagenome TaxID=412755 RepID=A0A0F9SX42_9ZZZZ
MGLTKYSYDLLMKYAKTGDQMLELGNQTIYFGDDYGKPAKPMFEKMGFEHISIDLNGEDGAFKLDLGKKWKLWKKLCDISILFPPSNFDIVTDFGTSEHVKNIYNCWFNKYNFCKTGGYIISENPKTGNWKGHGHWYCTEEFYRNLAKAQGYEIIELGEHPAMGNTTDGWNIYCVLKKIKSSSFITKAQFNKLGIKNV